MSFIRGGVRELASRGVLDTGTPPFSDSEEEMRKTTYGAGDRSGNTFLECVGLAAVGLLALKLAFAFPATEKAGNASSSWRERDWRFWYQAHQLYQREPEELNRAEFENVQRWCRCLLLTAQHEAAGNDSLTGDECQFVEDVLGDLCPNLEKHGGYLPIYEACRRRLDGDDRTACAAAKGR